MDNINPEKTARAVLETCAGCSSTRYYRMMYFTLLRSCKNPTPPVGLMGKPSLPRDRS